MQDYLIKLTPLEPYFFGGEQNFAYGQVKRAVRQNYFIKSLLTPSQTTLLGALRYAVLAAENSLITDYKNAEQRAAYNNLVGEKSFSFTEERDYGKIGSISPLFIMDGDDYYVHTPMNHKASQKSYSPFNVIACNELKVSCGNGFYAEDYIAKEGCGGGWTRLDGSLEIIEDADMFLRVVKVGINAHRTDGKLDNKESYFKKEYIHLRKEAFAFFAEIEASVGDKLCKGITVFLGQNKSAFELRAERCKNDLSNRISSAFSGKSNRPFYYAIGDCYIENVPEDMFVAQSQLFRHLTTNTDDRFYYRINKSEKLYRLIKAGAVFYTSSDDFVKNKNCDKAGMNILVYIGGKE